MTTIEKIRAELHATAEMHEDGAYYLRDKWVDEIIDKYAEQDKCEHNCEDCEHNDGECCRILFERSFEQLRTEVERATIEMDYETAQESLAVIDRYMEQESSGDAISRQAVLEIIDDEWLCNAEYEFRPLVEAIEKLPSVRPQPCDDAISRQAIKKLKRHNLVEGQFVSLYDIERLPSVRPQCEEREKGECPWYAG